VTDWRAKTFLSGLMMNETSPILLGELLAAAELISQRNLELALKRASRTGLPLGLELILQGSLDFEMLTNCIVAQSQVRDGLLSRKSAVDALSLAGKKKVQLKVALDVMGVDFASNSKNRLGALLTDCGLLDRAVLKQCLGLSKSTGLPLGRVLIASGVLKAEILDKAVRLQKLLRLDEIDRAHAIEDLETIQSLLGSISSVGNSSPHVEIDLPSLLLDANLLLPERVNALRSSCLENSIDFEEALAQSDDISSHVIAAAKILLKMIEEKMVSYRAGADLLKRVNYNHDLQRIIGEVQMQPAELTFNNFLVLTRLSHEKTFKRGPIGYPAGAVTTDSGMEDTWQVLPAVSEEIQDVAKIMPTDVVDCLERNGFLTAESKLDVVTAARQYKLFRHNELNIDQALVTYHLAKQERQYMPAWSGTFPSLAIWLPRVQ
jgi:hypothetical protein